jgi:hypothetical protein
MIIYKVILVGLKDKLIIEHLEQNFEHVLTGNKVYIISRYYLCWQNSIGLVMVIF